MKIIESENKYCQCQEPTVKVRESYMKCTKCGELMHPEYKVAMKWIESLTTIPLVHLSDGNIIKTI